MNSKTVLPLRGGFHVRSFVRIAVAFTWVGVVGEAHIIRHILEKWLRQAITSAVSMVPDGFLAPSFRIRELRSSADYARRRRGWLLTFLRSGDVGL